MMGFSFRKAVAAAALTPGYRLLVDTVANEPSHAVDATDAAAVLLAERTGCLPENIYFSAYGKTESDLQQVLGKCRFVAGSAAELKLINDAAEGFSQPERLVSVGLRLIPESYDDGRQSGIPVRELPEIAGICKQLSAITVRGCFIQGNIAGLHGKELGRYYRTCYETAKRMSVTLPCAIPFLCVGSCTEAIAANQTEHPETLEEFQRAAAIVAAQNQTAFYATLLVK